MATITPAEYEYPLLITYSHILVLSSDARSMKLWHIAGGMDLGESGRQMTGRKVEARANRNVGTVINQSIFITPEGITETHNKMLKQEKYTKTNTN